MEAIYRILKSKVVVYSIVLFYFLCGCKFDSDWDWTVNRQLIHYKPTFYKYNIAQKTFTKITSLDKVDIMSPANFIQILRDQMLVFNDNTIVYVNRHNYLYSNIQVIDAHNGSLTNIDLDSLNISEGYISASPVEHKIAFAAYRKYGPSGGGLYVLDLDTRTIKLIKSTGNGTLEKGMIHYFQPSFSHDGKIITYAQHIYYVNREVSGSDVLTDYSLWTNDLSNHQDKKICNGNKPVGYPFFDQTDEHIYAKGNAFWKVSLASGQVDTIDNRHSFQDTFEGLPPFLITGNGICYSLTLKTGYPQEHEIYYYDAMAGKSSFLMKGFMPMSENSKNGNILIRANGEFTNAGSAVQIINKKGAVIETLRTAMWASYYPDGDNILFLIFDV